MKNRKIEERDKMRVGIYTATYNNCILPGVRDQEERIRSHLYKMMALSLPASLINDGNMEDRIYNVVSDRFNMGENEVNRGNWNSMMEQRIGLNSLLNQMVNEKVDVLAVYNPSVLSSNAYTLSFMTNEILKRYNISTIFVN